MKHTILCIDDEIDNLDALERLLRKKYQVLRAASGKEALAILDLNPEVAAIISDQRMPEMTGVELLEKSLVTHQDTVRILLTGYTDIESVIAAVNLGNIFRYLTKPWDTADLLNSVHQAIEKYELSKTLKVKNKELELALENLKKLDLAKSKFMILINHELKTPLTVIQSYLELLKEQTAQTENLQFIDKAIKSSSRLQEIIENVLIIMKHQTDQLEKENRQIYVLKVIRNIILKFSHEIEKKNLNFNVSIPENFNIQFNEKYLDKIFYELIKNSITWAHPNSAIIINLNIEPDNNTHLSIENEGPTISQEIIEKVSEPFKLPENIMNHSKGLGLGLSLSEALLNANNSKLIIQNSAKGVRVSFLLKNS